VVSVIISTFNRARFLPVCFESLKNQTINKDAFEIILIDNNCTDNTAQICKDFSDNNKDIKFRYFIETNQGLSFARNRGIKESSGDIVTFLDDDAYADSDFIKKIDEFMKNNQNAVSVGGKILLHFETISPKWLNKYLASLLGYFNPSDDVFRFNKKNYPRGSNMTFRKDVFEKIGYFNTNLGRKGGNLEGSEEKDLYSRLYSINGAVFYLPQALVYHVIPDERTKSDFIRRQAIGVGRSEWNRVSELGIIKQTSRLIIEVYKWVASIILSFYFIFTFKFQKGIMIMKFRFWVTKGLLNLTLIFVYFIMICEIF
jgi:glucosyl-dolichyl phosphate glucuronosyltransferase